MAKIVYGIITIINVARLA